MPVVRANLKESVNNVRTELLNAKDLTGKNVDLAPLWDAYFKEKLTKMEVWGSSWVTDRIKEAEPKVEATVKTYKAMKATLVTKEKQPAHNTAQNLARTQADAALKTAENAVDRAKQLVKRLEADRETIVKDMAKAK